MIAVVVVQSTTVLAHNSYGIHSLYSSVYENIGFNFYSNNSQ